ncbi:putative phage antitermination protein Q [Yersinia frederiksenii]|uniref:Phage antitermination protein Q n=1 Tax=Yersinia frederiksenii TaxID=29484 RepID=A0AAI9ER57_YERFR|nr:putative phage antitermination protein Q [Yersinia frederiksenii]
MTTWRAALVALIATAFLFLLLNRNHLANKVDKTEAELVTEQATNVALGNIIDAYQANDAANRASTTRQLENERKLRNESDERLRRFKASAESDDCSIKPLPDASIVILQE